MIWSKVYNVIQDMRALRARDRKLRAAEYPMGVEQSSGRAARGSVSKVEPHVALQHGECFANKALPFLGGWRPLAR